MSESKQVGKDIEFLERVGRWLGEKQEVASEAIGRAIRRIVPSRNTKAIEAHAKIVEQINAREAEFQELDQDGIRGRMQAFRERLAGEEVEAQETILDEILPEVFALVREAAKRALGMRHYDVQLIGGMVLHKGSIAEMATGEGKTLVATLAAALNALAGRGTYVVTVNDYLAKRDRDWMAPVYEYLGLTVGAIQSEMDPNKRQDEYACDITYGTNNEFGFDYLRDNMRNRVEQQVQKQLHFAIVDEVDSILVDEARTPLIISGMPEASSRKYYLADGVARKLREGEHFEVKEKEHTVVLSDEGIELAQSLLNVPSFYEGPYMDWPHHIEQSLKAHNLYKLDKHYVKRPDDRGAPEIVIVDEFTGRMMPGRRWSDGLHQAVEAKEGIRIREESQTLATITFQNYFRLYHKLAGMTGTAITEAGEFAKIYSLDVVQIPTNRPNQRADHEDVIYRTEQEKFPTIVDELVDLNRDGRPVLVGTASIEKSELLARYLTDPSLMVKVLGRRATHGEKALAKAKKIDEDTRGKVKEMLARPARITEEEAREVADRVLDQDPKSDLAFWLDGVARAARAVAAVRAGFPHKVLNAKFHQMEAGIVAQAGRLGAITIATNMAGRGTDIKLGGDPEGPGQGRGARDRRQRPLRRIPRALPEAVWRGEGEGPRAGRTPHSRHRTPRIAPHRQPAPRADGAPRRSGIFSLLPVVAGRLDADLRQRPRQPHSRAGRDDRGRGHPECHGLAIHPTRTEEGGGAELRHSKEPPRIRRGDGQAAQAHLRPAPGSATGRRGEGPRPGHGGGRGRPALRRLPGPGSRALRSPRTDLGPEHQVWRRAL